MKLVEDIGDSDGHKTTQLKVDFDIFHSRQVDVTAKIPNARAFGIYGNTIAEALLLKGTKDG